MWPYTGLAKHVLAQQSNKLGRASCWGGCVCGLVLVRGHIVDTSRGSSGWVDTSSSCYQGESRQPWGTPSTTVTDDLGKSSKLHTGLKKVEKIEKSRVTNFPLISFVFLLQGSGASKYCSSAVIWYDWSINSHQKWAPPVPGWAWNALEPAWSVIAGCHRAQPTRVSGQLCGLEINTSWLVKGGGAIVDKEVGERQTGLPRRPPGPSADNDIWAVVWIGIDTSWRLASSQFAPHRRRRCPGRGVSIRGWAGEEGAEG